MDFKVCSESELPEIAEKILGLLNHKVVLFYGEMGVGKTTLIKQMCKVLGVTEATTSPTFSIVNEYQSEAREAIYHFDFYRIEEEEEVFDLGYEDYFYGGAYCFIEWPEKIPNLLPQDVVTITIQLDGDNNRLISVAS